MHPSLIQTDQQKYHKATPSYTLEELLCQVSKLIYPPFRKTM